MKYLLQTFSILHRQTDVYLNHQLEAYNLSSTQCMYILFICENHDFSQEDLAAELKIDKGSVAKSVKQLEALDYICRVKYPDDKRQYVLSPTKKAIDIYPQLLQITKDCENNALNKLAEKERDSLILLLEKMAM